MLNIEKLVDRCFRASGVTISVTSIKGDASARRYHRVLLDEGKTDGVSSLIVMELPMDAMKSDEASSGDAPEELPFVDVARHLTQAGIPVPKIYLDATLDGALLIEDLGETQFVDVVSGRDEEIVRRWYETAASLLARMHDRMTPIPHTSIAARRRFDKELLRWELDHYREWGIEACSDIVLDPNIRNALDIAFDEFATEISNLPQGFVHRDYQSRNLMVVGPEPSTVSLAVIDFQDALLGPRVYDLVALLNDSYVDLSSDLKEHIVRYYAKLRGIDANELRNEFYLVTIQRKLKDGGRFVFIDRVRKNPAFLPFVEKSFARVRTSLALIAGHQQLKDALAAADPTRF